MLMKFKMKCQAEVEDIDELKLEKLGNENGVNLSPLLLT